MRCARNMALGTVFLLFAVGTIGVSVAVSEDEVKMVFHVEGMR